MNFSERLLCPKRIARNAKRINGKGQGSSLTSLGPMFRKLLACKTSLEEWAAGTPVGTSLLMFQAATAAMVLSAGLPLWMS